MKKYISFVAVALVALFTSCSNDDITIERGVTIKVDPSGVVSPFPEEWSGELTTFDSSFKLRVRVLVYDENGLLVLNKSSNLDNYKMEMSISSKLATGTYTMLATTDLVPTSGSEYWTLTNENNINTATITTQDIGFGGKYRILGFCSQKLTVSENSQSVTLHPTPAGALIRMYYNNVYAYNNVKYYILYANRSSNSMTFDKDGNPNLQPYASPDGEFDVPCSYVDVENAQSDNLYGWYFLFPQDNISFRFVWASTDNKYYWMGNQFTISSIKIAEEWLISVDCETDEITTPTKYTKAAAKALVNNVNNAPQSIRKKEQNNPVPYMFGDFKSLKITDLMQK